MKILLLTFYFKPDLCAGSFRMTAFVDALKEKLGEGDRVDIVTTMPNRYATYTKACPEEEQLSENIFIKRIKLPAHKSGFIDQVRAFTFFSFRYCTGSAIVIITMFVQRRHGCLLDFLVLLYQNTIKFLCILMFAIFLPIPWIPCCRGNCPLFCFLYLR